MRLAGSPEEGEVIDYARRQLEAWGYRVEVQPFPASSELLRSGSLTVQGASGRAFKAQPFVGAASGDVRGPLVDAGTGQQEEFPSEAAGAVVLIQRRDVTFQDMVSRARSAGAAAVVIANKEPGRFLAGFRPRVELPVVDIDQADGQVLRELLASGPAQVSLHVDGVRQMTAHNVVARPADGPCRTLSGGHYDSVPVAPGATDNASGAAVVLDLARAAAAAGLTGDCFALFGAEEIGLVGSAYLVAHLSATEKRQLAAVFNYDVVAGDAMAVVIGDEALAQQALALGQTAGLDVEIGRLPEGASSDHASFLKAGIPALMLTVDDLGIIHTARDTLANLRPAPLETIANLGFALLSEVGGP